MKGSHSILGVSDWGVIISGSHYILQQRPSLPPRAITTHHPPRLVRQKCSTKLCSGREDSRSGRGSYRTAAATMTKAHGAGIYMPPEALEDKPEDENNDEEQEETRAKYDASLIWCCSYFHTQPNLPM